LTFKCGNHDTILTHYNPHYSYERSFRVFNPEKVKEEFRQGGFSIVKEDTGVDSVFVPYMFIKV